ncbi:hypothetical protein [Parachitinimonas caeni]|uniref:Uncharacterized protein n=1 Tax=Parachitinimonas caeni TaxID=3031301 RepID=A0ABT7E2T9_9NEIS|nr:hypothetical protein [Parachitinimonas caeni]MDK2126630.1 hypothetical protein [Parachitinimonas caeni]
MENTNLTAQAVATAAILGISKVAYDLYNDTKIREEHYAKPLANMPENADALAAEMKSVVDNAISIIQSGHSNDAVALSKENELLMESAGIKLEDLKQIQETIELDKKNEGIDPQLPSLLENLRTRKHDQVDMDLAVGASLQRNHEMEATRAKISGVGLMLSSFMKEKGLSIEQVQEKAISKLQKRGNAEPTVSDISREMIQSASRANQDLVGKLVKTLTGQGHAPQAAPDTQPSPSQANSVDPQALQREGARLPAQSPSSPPPQRREGSPQRTSTQQPTTLSMSPGRTRRG